MKLPPWTRLRSHPLTGLLWLLMLAASAALLDIDEDSGSKAGSWIGQHLHAGSRMASRVSPAATLSRTPTGFIASEMGEPLRLSSDGTAFDACLFADTQSWGWWGLTRELRRCRVMFRGPLSRPVNLSDQEHAEARAAFLVYLEHSGNSEWAELGRRAAVEGDWMKERILWPGVLHNGVTLLAAGGLLVWICSYSARLRKERRVARGLCARCAYNRRGLNAHAPCPECGLAPGTA